MKVLWCGVCICKCFGIIFLRQILHEPTVAKVYVCMSLFRWFVFRWGVAAEGLLVRAPIAAPSTSCAPRVPGLSGSIRLAHHLRVCTVHMYVCTYLCVSMYVYTYVCMYNKVLNTWLKYLFVSIYVYMYLYIYVCLLFLYLGTCLYVCAWA